MNALQPPVESESTFSAKYLSLLHIKQQSFPSKNNLYFSLREFLFVVLSSYCSQQSTVRRGKSIQLKFKGKASKGCQSKSIVWLEVVNIHVMCGKTVISTEWQQRTFNVCSISYHL